ncbi:DUF4336 domain-containing protein [Alkalinema sp. FACHB-956]|uniref:DUF4336 domain-containing protein n=1 Tax=Alkalinema sp. FACHB-956 TaxID=2692768 RepID=UPI001689DC8F|nr:DUF4336 domain-containing protein [Alkalinema sp. FACHB-956]MBD2330113.1 DUF4336 domain-containing protein [Alkalinema sp. FACHB-956]
MTQGRQSSTLSPHSGNADRSWNFWFTVPLYPYGKRPTLRTEVIPGRMWTFDQLQGIFYVVTPIRMTVVKLEAGGLLVYAPVAPTGECLRLMAELVQAHGEVKYIILPTVSGLEHKVFVGPFARRFPTAQVFVAPHQWSFPVNLPLSWLGLPIGRTQVLPEDSRQAPFGREFDYAMLGPINLGLGPFAEVAFFHRSSQTLLVTDSIQSVPAIPPAILQVDPYPLLFHGRDLPLDALRDTPELRLKGWKRIALFSFYFRPSALEIPSFGEAWQAAKNAPDRSRKAYFGLYPFCWKPDWERSFEILRGNGRLFVAPILQQLILNREPQQTIAWADRVAQWNFQRIIPCHLDAPIAATPAEFRQAFSFLEKQPAHPYMYPLPSQDFQLLYEIESGLRQRNITPAAKEKV